MRHRLNLIDTHVLLDAHQFPALALVINETHWSPRSCPLRISGVTPDFTSIVSFSVFYPLKHPWTS